MASLEQIRAKLLAQSQKSENNTTGDKASYPFWNTPENSTSVIRFLPDGNPDNTLFWVDRTVIKLPFQGIKGEHDKEVYVQVPCMEMYGETCPILSEIRPWWKDNELLPLAKRYWKKKSHIFQGFVVNSAFEEKDAPENPIRRFMVNPSIYQIIKESLMDKEMEDLPIDFTSGRDFKITKTKKGEYANYGTSSWSFKTRSLSDTELEAIEKYGLYNLKEFLPKKPTPDEVEIIKEMFRASVNDEEYDPARWGQHFRPLGSFGSTNDSSREDDEPTIRKVVSTSPKTVTTTETISENITTPSSSTPSASDILRRISEKRKAGV